MFVINYRHKIFKQYTLLYHKLEKEARVNAFYLIFVSHDD